MPRSIMYNDLVRGLTGQGKPRKSETERLNEANRQRNLMLAEEQRRANEAARIADKMGAKIGIRKDIRDAYTKLFRKA